MSKYSYTDRRGQTTYGYAELNPKLKRHMPLHHQWFDTLSMGIAVKTDVQDDNQVHKFCSITKYRLDCVSENKVGSRFVGS